MYVFVIGSAYIAIRLFMEGRSYPGSGWAIITSLLIFIIILEKYLRHKKIILERQKYNYQHIIEKGNNEFKDNFTVLISTKDPLKVQLVVNLLRENNIEYSVLDCHSTQMLRFLPDVEIRVMVLGKNYDESIKLVESLEINNSDA